LGEKPLIRRRVVITGLGVIAPNGIGEETFWSNLIAGKSGVDYISAFDPSPFPCKIAAEVRDFTPTDFMMARVAKNMARFSQLSIAATRLALESAQLSITASLSSQVAVCYGTCVNGAGDLFDEAALQLRSQGVAAIRPWAALEYPPHAAASYIAIEFGITGPALSVSSNCCTGIDAIHTAATQIAMGKTTVAIAGASDAPIFPVPFGGFCALGALTKRNHDPQGASRPYDLLRDGLVLGEGAASVVLEDLDFARSRNAPIYAEVLGYGAASEAIGMRKGDLEGEVMASALTQAFTSAGLEPWNIDHANAHGSSLPDFDVCDTNAFKKALGQHAYRIPISSIKSMIGQPISAAGAIQTVAACLSIKYQKVPPTINQQVFDARCDLDYVPNKSRTARVRNVLLNGHSFGGSVSALVIGKLEE
jgi:3-oxoacyl-[acyl-carrier-protein] synthase II